MSKDIPSTKATPPDEILAFYAAQEKSVLTFLGFADAGYERQDLMLDAASNSLAAMDPKLTIVNIGVTSSGIGAVYKLAKEQGFVTTGIVSTLAIEFSLEASPFVDHAFFVLDTQWGGNLRDGKQLSPTSKVMVDVSDQLIAIGGGEIARVEFVAAKKLSKGTTFIPAEMNHRVAMESTRRKGVRPPTDFRGALESSLAKLS